jgi:hypothetical protein
VNTSFAAAQIQTKVVFRYLDKTVGINRNIENNNNNKTEMEDK